MKRILLFILLTTTLTGIQAQDNTRSNGWEFGSGLKNKYFVGGGLGLQFGTVSIVDLSPVGGYYLTNVISVGLGFTYEYYKDNRYAPPFELNIYGGRAFTNLYITPEIFFHGEYECLTYNTNIYHPFGQYENIISENVLIGIGYKQLISDEAGLFTMLLYNANENIYTPYSNPVLRFGFEYAF